VIATRSPTLRVVAAVVACSAVIAVAGLYGLFEAWGFLAAAAAGAGAAAAAALLADRWRLLLGESIAASLVGLIVVGMMVTGGPSAFFSGLVHGWAEIVSVAPPADLTERLKVVPLVLAWFGAAAGCEAARLTRLPALPAAGPLLALGVAVLLGAEARAVALAQGAALGVAAVAIGVVQQRALNRERQIVAASLDGRRARTLFGVAATLTLVGVAAPIIGPRLPLANAHDRFELRQQTTPPWDPLSVPSPLVQVKASLDERQRDDKVFTVASAQPIARWKLAVLGDYDGEVWTVGSGETGSAASEFRAVDSRLPRPDDDVGRQATVEATVVIDNLAGPWVPTPGVASSVDFDGGVGLLRANLRTGTLAVAEGVPAGTKYDIAAHVPTEPGDDALAQAEIDAIDVGQEELDALPPPVRNLTADILQGQALGWRQVATVRDRFRQSGFYDATPRVPPGHSWYRLGTFLADPQQVVGFEEQYAAAAAVMLRIVRLPTRVVVGYVVPDDRWAGGRAEVFAGDMSAWIEVEVAGYGWLPVDVTPPRTQTPNDQQQGTVFEDVAVPNPPPPPQPPPKVEVLTDEEKEEADDTVDDTADAPPGAPWSAARKTLVGSGVALALVLGAGAVVIGLKRRRRRRRHTMPEVADRIAGAWFELEDRCREADVPLRVRSTPHESARALLDAHGHAAAADDLFALAGAVDRAAYHPLAPADEEAAQAWQHCDRVVEALRRDRSRRRRVLMSVDPRPLRHRDPLAGRRQ
jgi:transglutaminase-like putative cysteine protease